MTAAKNVPAYTEQLALFLGRYTAASSAAIGTLCWPDIAPTSAIRRLRRLVDDDLVTRVALSQGKKAVYQLRPKAISAFTSTRKLKPSLAKPLAPSTASFAWCRSEVHRLLVEDGFRVGNDASAVLAMRRYYLDRLRDVVLDRPTEDNKRVLLKMEKSPMLQPPVYWSCSGCSYQLHAKQPPRGLCPVCTTKMEPKYFSHRSTCSQCDYTGYDADHHQVIDGKGTAALCPGKLSSSPLVDITIAWRRYGARYEILFPLVDEPTKSVLSQVQQLPVFGLDQPTADVLFAEGDPLAEFDAEALEYPFPSRRRQDFAKILAGQKGRADFPYGSVFREAQLRPLSLPQSLVKALAPPASKTRSAYIAELLHESLSDLSRPVVVPPTGPKTRVLIEFTEDTDELLSELVNRLPQPTTRSKAVALLLSTVVQPKETTHVHA